MKSDDLGFKELFDFQVMNQETLIAKGSYEEFSSKKVESVPVDDPRLCSYHVQQMISEIGEVLDADKRWKNFRNDVYNKEAKLEEIADCFIVMMNIAMFSGFDGNDVAEAIAKKIAVVRERIKDV